MMRDILFLAEPFGFGPISSSVAVVRQIKSIEPQRKVLFAGGGTSYQLAACSDAFDEVTFIEELTSDALAAYGARPDNNGCFVVANTFPGGVALAKHANLPCAFVDTLYWMWNHPPIDMADVQRYYIEDFHCIGSFSDRFGNSEKLRVVGPLVDLSASPAEVSHPLLLVSLGGIDSSLYDFPVFYEKLISFLSTECKLQHYQILLCGGGKRMRQQDFASFVNSRLTIQSLPQQQHISYLKSADLVLASAGLHGFYENFYLQKNVMFLPPQSYSQYLQLRAILKRHPRVLGANFEQLGMPHSLRENMPDAERIGEVKRTNIELAKEPIFASFVGMFEEFYSGRCRTQWDVPDQQGDSLPGGALALAKDLLDLCDA